MRAVVKHAFPMMLAQVIPLGASFVVVLLALVLGRTEFVTVIGVTATIAGLSTLITVGVGVATLRELAPAGDDQVRIVTAITKNLRIASAVSFIVLAISVIVAVVLWAALPEGSAARPAVWLAFALQAPGFLVAAHTSVLSSTFQHLGRERDNLGITLTRTLITLVIGIFVVLFIREPLMAIGVQSAVSSVMAIAMLLARRRRLSRSQIAVRILHAPKASVQEIWDRVMNSLDGAVFMVLFLVAQLVAASISLEVAAQVAGGVAFCRTVVIPLKMIGQTAGRMNLRDDEAGLRFALASFAATGLFVVPIAAALVIAAAFGFSPFGNLILNILIAAQLLVEPFAGSLFAYLKVSFGPRAGLLGLVVTYLVIAPVLLLVCRFQVPTAQALWICLLVVRVCFSISNLGALRQGLLATAPHARRASGTA